MKKIIFSILIILGSLCAKGQIYFQPLEFGLGLGGANYFGDLNQSYGMEYFRQSGSIFIKYNFGDYIALGARGTYAHVGYSDSYSTNFFQQQRNLDFKSNIFELSVMADFHFFRYQLEEPSYRYTPYVTIGLGLFYYDPYTHFDDVKYFLRPLGTEGQYLPQYADRQYEKTAVSFPMGLGVKYWVTKGLTFGAEVIHRMTTTDYLDDVSTTYVGIDKFPKDISSPYPTPASQLQDRSQEIRSAPIGIEGRQRGISSTRDQFFTAQLYLSLRLPTYKCPDNR